MTPRRLILVLVAIAAVAAIVIVVATCGDDDGEPSGSGGETAQETSDGASSDGSPFERDPCELLTDADLRDLLGQAVEGTFAPGEEESATPGRCEWATGRAVGDGARASGIAVFLGDEQLFENTRALAEGGEDFEQLDGIGDDAYAGGGEGGVRIDDAAITVTPIGVNTNDPATHDLIADVLQRIAANY